METEPEAPRLPRPEKDRRNALGWMRLSWDAGYAARVYLVVGLVVAMAAAVLVRLGFRGDMDLSFDSRQAAVVCAAGAVVASVTLADWRAVAAGYGSYALAYAVTFPLLLAATRTELTIQLALDTQLQIVLVAAVWAVAAAVLLVLKLLLVRWVVGSRIRATA